MSKKALVPLNLFAGGSTPTGRYIGDAYFDTSLGRLKIYNGSVWLEFLPTSQTEEILYIDGGLYSTASYADTSDGGYPDSNYTSEYDGGGVWSTALYPDGPPIDFYDGGIFSTVYTASLDAGAYNTVYTEIGIDAGVVQQP
jgi:hypothetical protein